MKSGKRVTCMFYDVHIFIQYPTNTSQLQQFKNFMKNNLLGLGFYTEG